MGQGPYLHPTIQFSPEGTRAFAFLLLIAMGGRRERTSTSDAAIAAASASASASIAASQHAQLFQGVDKRSTAFKLLNSMGWKEGEGLVGGGLIGRVHIHPACSS